MCLSDWHLFGFDMLLGFVYYDFFCLQFCLAATHEFLYIRKPLAVRMVIMRRRFFLKEATCVCLVLFLLYNIPLICCAIYVAYLLRIYRKFKETISVRMKEDCV